MFSEADISQGGRLADKNDGSDFCATVAAASVPSERKRPREPDETRETSDARPPLVVLTGTTYFADDWSRIPKLLEATPGVPQIVSLEKLRECADLRTVVDRASRMITEDDRVWTIAIDLRKSAQYDDTFRDAKTDFLTSSLHADSPRLEKGFRARIRDFIDEVYDGFVNDDDDDENANARVAGGLFESKEEQSGTIVGKVVFKI